jgi:hypothetical protein
MYLGAVQGTNVQYIYDPEETVGLSQELGLLRGLDRNVPRTLGQVVLLF